MRGPSTPRTTSSRTVRVLKPRIERTGEPTRVGRTAVVPKIVCRLGPTGANPEVGDHTPRAATPRRNWDACNAAQGARRELEPLVRFWRLLAAGLVAAILVGVLASFAEREPYEYTASAQLLVTSNEAPYYRISITREQLRPLGADGPEQPVLDTDPPDTQTLVQAANLYPVLIESDPVTQTRRELFGGTPGSVEARAVFSVQTPNRFEESSVPVIEVDAVSTDRGDAVTLADDTVAAFASWIEGQQETANVPEDDRILIKPLTAAHVVSQVGGPSYGIPVLLAAAVLLAFGGAAFVVDSLTRRQRQTAGARNSASTSGRASRRRGEARSSA